MSLFLFDGDASTQNYNLIAPAGHTILSGNSVSYSYQGATPSQVVYVFGSGFTYSGSSVTGGNPLIILGTDNGLPLFETRVYGATFGGIAQLSTLSFADQVKVLSNGGDYFAGSSNGTHTNAFSGGPGDDSFSDSLGTNTIDGGDGTDTAILKLNFTDASFTYNKSSGTLTVNGSGHQDTITNVEHFNFNDRSFTSLQDLSRAAGFDTGFQDVYRFYDRVTNDHFFTTDPAEKASIQANLKTFTYEGVAFEAPDAGSNTTDVFRFYDTATKTHFYTASVAERDSVIANVPSYTYEGVTFHAYTNPSDVGVVALERFYNTNSKVHTYATGDEITQIKNGGSGAGWIDEGVGFLVHA